MKKKYLLLPILALAILCSCGGGGGETLTRQATPTTTTTTQPALTTTAISGSTTSTATVSTTAEEVSVSKIKDLSLIPGLFVDRLYSYKSYKAVTSGKTTASVLFINTDQSIEVTNIKGVYSYTKNESHSSLVNTVHEAYYHNDKAYYHDNDGEYKVSTINEYLDIYGVYPYEKSLEGYSIQGDAVKSVEKVEERDGNYKFKITFDPKTATNNVKIQMKQFGGLDGYPDFESIVITITIKDDFTPVLVDLESKYKATKFMTSDCHQTYTVTYSNIGEDITIPNLDGAKANI